jgi:FHA domain-containing protein/cohesin domain-containing protein
MKRISAFLLAMALGFSVFINAHAQTAETIWLTANTTTYKTGETVAVTVNAASATPIQGFTFQIHYDPACLKPNSASSPVSGMNGLTLPQTSGLVDANYASTSPQAVNGVLAEVYFQALKGCKTDLTLESAALVVKNASGFATPLTNVTVAASAIALNIDKEVGSPQNTQPLAGSNLSLVPTRAAPTKPVNTGLWIGLLALLFVVGAGTVLFIRLRNGGNKATPKSSTSNKFARVEFRHGPYAGQTFSLNKLPFLIGSDPMSNDICLEGPHILEQHAKIYTTNNKYYLIDMGGETFVNGRAIRRSSSELRPGDVVRLGKSSLFVFG